MAWNVWKGVEVRLRVECLSYTPPRTEILHCLTRRISNAEVRSTNSLLSDLAHETKLVWVFEGYWGSFTLAQHKTGANFGGKCAESRMPDHLS